MWWVMLQGNTRLAAGMTVLITMSKAVCQTFLMWSHQTNFMTVTYIAARCQESARDQEGVNKGPAGSQQGVSKESARGQRGGQQGFSSESAGVQQRVSKGSAGDQQGHSVSFTARQQQGTWRYPRMGSQLKGSVKGE